MLEISLKTGKALIVIPSEKSDEFSKIKIVNLQEIDIDPEDLLQLQMGVKYVH